MNVPDHDFKKLLEKYPRFTVYGLSSDSQKPSYYVPEFVRSRGWSVVGVYPKSHQQGGFKIYPTLAEVPLEFRRFVNVFRASDKVDSVVEEILKVGGVEVLWLQLGISNALAENKAEAAGIQVVSDRCLIIEHRKWNPQLS